MPNADERVNHETHRITFGWLAVGAGLLWLIYLLAPVLTPFVLAAIFAYIFQPLVLRMGRRGVPRTVSVLIVLLMEAVVLLVLMLAVLPLFIKEFGRAIELVPAFLDRMDARIGPWIQGKTGFVVALDAASIKQWLTDMIQTTEGLATQMLRSLRLGGLGLIGLLANAVLIPVVQFYLMRDWETMLGRLVALIPPDWRPAVASFFSEANDALGQYLHGQILVILMMAAFYTLGLWLADLDLFMPIGIITGVLVFVPYLGSITGFFLATFAAIMQFPELTSVIWVWAVFVMGQMLEGYFVVPRLVGERIGLHPVAVIFALLAFGQIFGFFGLLLALPASAVLLVGLTRLKTRYLASELYRGRQD